MKTPLQRRFLTVLCLLLSTFCVIAAEISPTGNILYVKKGATGNGSSWTNALGELSEALQWAQANKDAAKWDASNPLKIYVAKGTYTPSINPVDNTPVSAGNQRDATFLLVKDVQIYGGFAGTETTLTDRDLTLSTNASILSGDFNGDDAGFTNNGENACHVVISVGAVGTATLNGFTITNGNANGSGYIMVNTKAIFRSAGGGIYNETSSPVLTHVIISANTTTTAGGGISSNNASYPVLTNVSINGNTATNAGGGIYNYESSPVLTNVTISANTANFGGGISNSDPNSKPQIRNSIIYGNNTGIEGAGTSVISYSLVQGLSSTANNNMDGNTDPQFVDAANGDYSLKNTSPLINKGDNSLYTGLDANTKDLAGNARVYKFSGSGIIDMGAYEYQGDPVIVITPTNNILYVKKGATGNGSSWTNALGELSEALQWAQANKSANLWDANNPLRIYVAKGTYTPDINPVDNTPVNAGNKRDATFLLVKDVQVYGGFAGTETLLTDRNLNLSTNASILSGDLGTVNTNTDNAYHVVISAGDVGTAELNGFTITGGNASDIENIMVNSKTIYQYYGGGIYNAFSSPVLTNVSISANTANHGGGILNDNSSPILTYVSISENKATNGSGGGIYNAFSSPVLTNVSISANTANHGGGIFNYSSSPVLTNVTISANTATYDGGGIYNDGTSSKPQIRNSIIYGNNTGIYNSNGAAPVISYSLVQGLTDTNNGNINGNTSNPDFVDATNGDYSLKNTSPVINKGSDTYFDAGQTPNLSAITTDIAGNPRIQKGNIDMGAYESPYNTPLAPNASGVIYVTTSGAGNQSGNSWANATNDLQMAINATGVQQVWVAGGTYKPKYRADNMSGANANDRDNAFVLKNNVQVYGGFAGTETALTDRNLTLSTNASILSGDFNGDDAGFTNNGENANHVVVSSGNNNSAMLNGFTLSGANASSSTDILINGNQVYQCSGGGIYLSVSSPVLQNLMITRNTAGESGGGIFGYESSPVLSGITILRNQAKDGGGIANQSHSSPVLSNIIITENEATELGGGLYNVTSSSPVLTNVTISRNTATINGGGIYNGDTNSEPQVRNSIIYDNNTGIFGGTPVISYSLVQGLTDTNNGNMDGSTDPQFVDVSTGDYSLKNTSPAINAGSNSLYIGLDANTKDLAGNARLVGTNIDMGAYENQDGVLPVTLVNYTAKANGNQVKLQWQTAEEQNNKGFVIYRSGDNTLFTPIGEVPVTDNLQPTTYNFTDTNPLNGNNYYKLVQVDKDGTATELGIRIVGFSLSAFSLQLFPNPTTELVHSSFSSNSYNLLTIADLNGRVLQQLQIQAGESSITVSLADYPTGTYLLRFSGKDGAVIKKVVKR
ncbi:choice-of-anchor Q domain-containing protein [Pseudopedobacter beijingensis]|uniref:Choice-of-anchor Q domain-containing protein n=1 Tax=Pseudopedobacter beijingensis TaxID=1207056 RepID=A0ABW4IAR8_9SPHI